MKITMAQSAGQMDDPESNYSKVKMVVGNIDADLFVFPEMFLCGYVGTKERMYTKVVEERVIDKLKEYSKKRDCAIICGGPRSDSDKIHNSAYFINGDDVRAYDKIHLSSGAVCEKDLYAPGNSPSIIDHKGLRFGLAVSRDLYFPELFRYYANNDVDIIVCISAASEETMKDHEKLIAARAVENSVYILFVNMVGPIQGGTAIGRSRWVSPKGEILEGCTESSDVRQLRIDDQEIKSAKTGRSVLKEVRRDINWN